MRLGQLILFTGDVPELLGRLATHRIAMSTRRTYGPRTFSDGMDPEGNVFQIATHA